MKNIESPMKVGSMGDMGKAPETPGGKIASPKDVGMMGDYGTSPAKVSGTLVSPSHSTNMAEAKEHK